MIENRHSDRDFWFARAPSAQRCRSLGSACVVTPHTVLVTPDLLVQLVGEPVDGSVHISIRVLCEQGFSSGVNRSLGLLLQRIFHLENDIYGYHVIEVSGNPLELFGNVCSQGWRNFYVMSCDIDLHVSLHIFWTGFRLASMGQPGPGQVDAEVGFGDSVP
jgi:hypothetical protein